MAISKESILGAFKKEFKKVIAKPAPNLKSTQVECDKCL